MALKNIWIAAGDGDLDRVRHLVEQESVSPNAPDEFTYTPMHAAASYGQIHVLELLISRGGDVNVQDEDGDTPIYTVENVETARFLVEHGATLERQNSEGVSPIDHLREEFSEVANYLQSVLSPASATTMQVTQEPSQQQQDVALEQLTSSLMASVEEIMQRAEAEGRDPDEELRAVVSRTVLEGVVTGYAMAEAEPDETSEAPTKKARVE
ncbi:ankyrin repeat-containing domain protein [Roridomyces roridus]|uniref:Ankyrin repeat-containing domain protein n=1 Tax=Roridomyces roridus TaxID=1738132 RepID=A0AAD7CJD2_9AGAR|nr:ankyrin repeat-containing domain protein [Roridomyces roridus]